ncbi:MAG: tail fiber domain-containing protein, partial [Bacteroidota bacterium]
QNTFPSSGNAGIGTTSPNRSLEIVNSNFSAIRLRNALGGNNAKAWIEFGQTESGTWSRSGYIGDGTSFNRNIFIALENGADLLIGSGSNPSTNSHLFVETSNGNVGINTTSPSQKLNVAGSVLANAYLLTSDNRFKKNVKSIENNQSKLYDLRGVSYEMDRESFKNYDFDDKKHFGLIAQEVREVFPEIVHENQSGYLSVDYMSLIPILIEALKNQNKELVKQAERINELGKQLKVDSYTDIESESSRISLSQNIPNPFTADAAIRMILPEEVVQADLIIYNLEGKQIQQHLISDRGNTELTLQGGSLEPGMYIYALLADGKVIDQKRMILTK